jgi:hypothetical protein
MASITSQAQVKRLSRLSFCYLCGQPFRGFENDRDHVPPNAIFQKRDRDFPLILPTHRECNRAQSVDDSKIGNLFRLLRGEEYQSARGKLGISEAPIYPNVKAIDNLYLQGIIRRWVRGFHSALYGEFLPDRSNFSTSPPLASTSEDQTERPLPETHAAFTDALKKNRTAGTMDRIICRNNTCIYECVWVLDDRSQWMCIFCLDIYGWIKATPRESGLTPRGCVGAYWMPDRTCPILGTSSTVLDFPFINRNTLDPFAP